MASQMYVKDFTEINLSNLAEVGGKNASLGEMIQHLSQAAVQVPGGFATTAHAFREFLQQNQLDARISKRLQQLNIEDVSALAVAGQEIREWIMQTPLPNALQDAILSRYQGLAKQGEVAVAVRSSATAEDLPTASFAGQQETFLNIKGTAALLEAVHHVYASLYTDRAIAYRVHQGFAHDDVALSVGVQRMVRSDIGASGVMFSLDTESGFDQVVFITAAYGLGETVVQGTVNPDEFYVYKPNIAEKRQAILRRNLGSKQIKMVYGASNSAGNSVTTVDVEPIDRQRFCLSDADVETLARYAIAIEQHYQRPMDIEWAKDGDTGEIMILQARPETVKSRDNARIIRRYEIKQKGKALVEGRAIGQGMGVGVVRLVTSLTQMHRVEPGDVLVTDMTDPDWEPVMKRAAAIVTNRGGRTCHAAIIAREMGIPAIVGCGNATELLKDGELVTISCAEGDSGFVYQGKIDFAVQEMNVDKMPEIPFKIMLNVANPDRAFDFQTLPNAGIGLARLEFIINQMIGIHPNALLRINELDTHTQALIRERTAAYATPKDYYVQRLAEGIATLAAAFNPKPVIVRCSDFKSNEYAHLLGGDTFEPIEENPMIGFRGASRYAAESFKNCFALECEALRYVRETMGLTNVQVMVPFVRTLQEADNVLAVMREHGLESGKAGLRIIMMCEIPSNALMADEFLQRFDGFSIGSNDLTQLTLGLDRDSGLIASQFDERDPAVKKLLAMAIQACKKANKYIGICGQGPSDHPDLALWLMQQGIDSVSLNPDSVLQTWLYLADAN